MNKSFHKLIILSLIIAASLNTYADTLSVSGTISSDITWNTDTILVTDDIYILENVSLTIAPGIVVIFQGHYGMYVEGMLVATGDAGNKTIFTINDNTGFSNTGNTDGAWKGIKFSNTAGPDSSLLDYCIIEYCKNLYSSEIKDRGGAITNDSYSKLRISNCEIRNNIGYQGGGIMCLNDQQPLILNNVFQDNIALCDKYSDRSGGAIYCYEASPEINNNYFEDNTGKYGSVISCYSGNPRIIENILYLNNGETTLDLNSTIWEIAIEHNKITNNTGGAIYINGADTRIINNLICNNNGSGIKLYESKSYILNNTIVNNTTSLNGGGLCSWGGEPIVMNSIIYGNAASYGPQVFLDKYSSASFNNCNIEGDSAAIMYSSSIIDYKNNISIDPEFESPNSDGMLGDWSLKQSSKCINAGYNQFPDVDLPDLDLNGAIRVRHGIIDMGAFEKHITKISVSDIISEDTEWIADTILITGDIEIQPTVTVRICPGCKIIFGGQYKIGVFGTIKAIGLKDEPITFTSNDTIGFHDPKTFTGGWRGIFFIWDTMFAFLDTSIFEFCILEYMWGSFSNIQINNLKMIEFNHVEVRNNSSNSLNFYGGICLMESKGIIRNCSFHHNYFTETGSVLYVSSSNLTLSDNIVYNNQTNTSAIMRSSYKSYLDLNRNIFANNMSDTASIILFETSNVSFKNSLISNNKADRAIIHLKSSQADIINATIVNNRVNKYGAITLDGLATPVIKNTILWGTQNDLATGSEVYLLNENAQPLFYNCNIDGGKTNFGSAGNSTFEFTYENCIDSFPEFKSPTPLAGLYENTLDADWSLIEISPCINKGNADISPYNLGNTDVYLNPRIIGSLIDIGAIENQCGNPSIIRQPKNKIVCNGQRVEFSIVASDTVFYQWMKNEQELPGELSSTLVFDSVSLSDQGNYSCKIWNAYGVFESNTVSLIVNTKPKLLIKPPGIIWMKTGEPVILNLTISGSEPIVYQWKKDGQDLTGENFPVLAITPENSADEGEYHCYMSNACGDLSSSPTSLFLAPQICMVTVSTLTGNNLIIWEKQSIAPISTYNIFRESTAAGIFDLLDTIHYNNLSVYEDTTADPTKRAYIYKITGIDTSGTETDIDLCKPHKTIHLLVSTNPELKSTQLAWDKYYGFDYQTYNIYRSATGTNFTVIDAMPSSLNSWTDPEPLSGELYYRVAVEKPVPCIPVGGGKKADSGPYSHSMSNIDDNRLQAGEYPPDTLILTNHYIDENNQVGKLIGRFMTTDPDTNDAFTYTLVSGDGDDDNLSFTLLSDLLIAADYFDYETKNQYSIRIRSTDKAGNIIEGIFVIYINDLAEPTGMNFPTNQQIVVYPNPMRDVATLVFPNPEGRKYTLIIMNLAGKVVQRIEDITTSSLQINRGDLEKGYYLIELKGNRVFRGKMIIE